eukprot:jgi/Chrzof1/1022/Cz01g37130.t1
MLIQGCVAYRQPLNTPATHTCKPHVPAQGCTSSDEYHVQAVTLSFGVAGFLQRHILHMYAVNVHRQLLRW